MTYTNGTILKNHVDRLDTISSAILRGGRRRAQDTAIAMSQRGAMKAAADRCGLAIMRLIELAYQIDPDTGTLANVDTTGLFNQRIAMPWSSRNYGRYGLQRTEADVLKIHVDRLQEVDVPPLWIYFGEMKRWACNLIDYPDTGAAVAYWRRAQLTARDYQMISQQVRSRRGG